VRNISLVVLTLLLAVMVAADVSCMKCGESIAKKATEKALEGAVNAATGGKSNIDVSGNVDLTGLPSFAVYPGVKGTAKWSISGDDGAGYSYVLESADPVATVVAWYKSSFEGSGWKQGATMESGEGTMFMYGSPDEKEMVTATISKDEAKTSIVLLHTKKQ
jgi:hypothetical protein